MRGALRSVTRSLRLATVSVHCLLVCSTAPGQAPSEDVVDPTRGERLFVAQCARCHGMAGEGGEGPTLQSPSLRHASNDRALAAVIRFGIPGTAMPGSWMLSTAETDLLVGYVRSLGRIEPDPEIVSGGDPERGRALYGELGCEACHVLAGRGRGIGPELTRIGAQRGLAYLRDSLLDPDSTVSDDFLQVRVTTADGTSVQGLRIREDAFTLQVRDLQNRIWSFDKSALRELRKVRGRSVMLSYGRRLDERQLRDLLAYLGSLRGETGEGEA